MFRRPSTTAFVGVVRSLLPAVCVVLAPLACSTPRAPEIQDDQSLTDNYHLYEGIGELPRHFSGTFSWSSQDYEQKVEVWFDEVRAVPARNVWIVRGHGQYTTRKVTEIEVRVEIDPETGRFEMWESNPTSANSESDTFVTDGSHVGEIDENMEAIEATWEGKSGQTGELKLWAVDGPADMDR